MRVRGRSRTPVRRHASQRNRSSAFGACFAAAITANDCSLDINSSAKVGVVPEFACKAYDRDELRRRAAAAHQVNAARTSGRGKFFVVSGADHYHVPKSCCGSGERVVGLGRRATTTQTETGGAVRLAAIRRGSYWMLNTPLVSCDSYGLADPMLRTRACMACWPTSVAVVIHVYLF